MESQILMITVLVFVVTAKLSNQRIFEEMGRNLKAVSAGCAVRKSVLSPPGDRSSFYTMTDAK